jgi:hypothetical protein
VVEGGEIGGADLIEVPSLSVAGRVTGPVWFACRPDHNFTRWMSQWMDQPIVGAVGGNVFASFRILIDYPAARATFEQV